MTTFKTTKEQAAALQFLHTGSSSPGRDGWDGGELTLENFTEVLEDIIDMGLENFSQWHYNKMITALQSNRVNHTASLAQSIYELAFKSVTQYFRLKFWKSLSIEQQQEIERKMMNYFDSVLEQAEDAMKYELEYQAEQEKEKQEKQKQIDIANNRDNHYARVQRENDLDSIQWGY